VTQQPLLPRELQIAASACLVAFLAWVVYLIRYHRLSLRDSLFWLLSTFAALLVTLFPESLRWTAAGLHVEVPSNALFGAAIVYLALNLLSTTITASNQAARLRRVTQECTLLRAEIDELRTRVDGTVPPRRAS